MQQYAACIPASLQVANDEVVFPNLKCYLNRKCIETPLCAHLIMNAFFILIYVLS